MIGAPREKILCRVMIPMKHKWLASRQIRPVLGLSI